MAEYNGDDGSAVVIKGQLLSLAEDFEDIRKGTRGVTEEQFAKAVKFAWLVSEGKSKAKAYAAAYNVDATAKTTYTLAAALISRKYVGDIINRMIAGNHVLMADKHITALNEMFDIGMDASEKTQDRLVALSKFAELTKKPEAVKIDYDITVGIGREMADKIDALTQNLAAKGAMISSSGEIIDTVVLD